MSSSIFNTIAVRILLHLTGWVLLIYAPDFFDEGFATMLNENPNYFWHRAFFFIPLIPLFYWNAYFLIPKYLITRNIRAYALALVSSLVPLWGLIVLIDYIYHVHISHLMTMEQWFFYEPIRDSILDIFFFVGLSIAYKFTLLWFKNERLKQQAELDLLKSQVNPHFLFNTLNSIYSLAHQKSDKTEDAILKLSQLMRYMIYDTNKNKVALSKEVDYLNDYIELQKLRISKNVSINFEVAENVSHCSIEPMLLIPFVENAFKHGISYTNASTINIRLDVTQKRLRFNVENTCHQQNKEAGTGGIKSASGFGLNNIRKRLALLYPNQHSLNISKKNNIHLVELTLQLEE